MAQAGETMRRLGAQTSTKAYERQGIMDRATSLVQLYEATGRPEKAAEWKKLLATIPGQPPPPPAPKQPE